MSTVPVPPPNRRVALLTLGCARNEVDSEELAGRLAAGGWEITEDGEDAAVVMVNTCGFVEQAKQESIDTLLAAADTGAKVVAAGCLAERYGRHLADSLPEADAVLGFDHYPQIAEHLSAIADGRRVTAHEPRDRRTMLPIAPVDRQSADTVVPGHADRAAQARDAADVAAAPAHLRITRRRLAHGPVANVKIASGCDRRCSFCAIPSFRGAFISRHPDEIVAETRWLAEQGVTEISLVSENTTSYGKDLGDTAALDRLLPRLAAVDGISRVRLSYLQPAELRAPLIEAIATTPGVVPYFDLSFQHASATVLRRMRRFGSVDGFLALLDSIRELAPSAGARTNVIVGFPGETEAEFAELEEFLGRARLDAIGVFGYSDEDGTEAAGLPGKLDDAVVSQRVAHIGALADEVCAERAAERIGERVEVLVEHVGDEIEGRAAHQAPEVDGATTLVGDVDSLSPGELVAATVVDSVGVDLVAEVSPGGGEPSCASR